MYQVLNENIYLIIDIKDTLLNFSIDFLRRIDKCLKNSKRKMNEIQQNLSTIILRSNKSTKITTK